MTFRQATPHDLPTIYEILEGAIRRLGEAGVDQWQHGYPNRARIEADVKESIGYVIEQADEVLAYGAVLFDGEPSYRTIEGAWLTEQENYVVVHRMCVAEKVLGQGFGRYFMQAVERLACGRVSSFRVDTHADNRVMQSLLPRLGFTRCGIIYFESRHLIAFEKIL